jgi:hypothetical protein
MKEERAGREEAIRKETPKSGVKTYKTRRVDGTADDSA